MSTERPILFSGPMVRAILGGTKTQTRRIVKPQPAAGVRKSVFVPSGVEDGHGRELRCPYAADRLWVKETHRFPTPDTIEFRADGVIHRVQDNAGILLKEDIGQKWRPSLFMWHWASRITLEVVSVRVERLNNISEEDAKAEGTKYAVDRSVGNNWSERQAFSALWESINGPGSWDKNPWVWVVEFKRITPGA